MKISMILRTTLIACLGMAVLQPAMAADKPGKEQKRLQQMLHKAEQEKSEITQQKAEVEGQLKEAQGKLEETQHKADARAAKLNKELATLAADKDALAAKLVKTEKQLADTSAKLRQTETDRSGLEATGQKQRETIAKCEGNNAKLYQYGTELLTAYEHKGCGSALLQAEPVTGLKRVEIENLIEDYRDKLNDQQVPATQLNATGKVGG